MRNEAPSDRSPAQALKDLLAKPLRFGDASQIEALFILRLAEQLLETPRNCPECGGEGESAYEQVGHCDHCGRECPYCDERSDICHTCKGAGTIAWTRDLVYAFRASRILELLQPEDMPKAA